MKPFERFDFGHAKHRLRQKLRASAQVAMRPMLLQWRSANLKNYLQERDRAGLKRGLHMGANAELLEGWFNCDIDTINRELNYVDASRPLPFSDSTFDYVFSEHFFEHLNYEQGAVFLKEAFRVLKPGGVLRTAIPDLSFAVDLYAGKTPLHQRYTEWYVKTFLPGKPVSPVPVINTLFYGFGHRFIYDEKLLRLRLEEAGFEDLRTCTPGQSEHLMLKNVEQHGRVVPREFNELETTVIEATKRT